MIVYVGGQRKPVTDKLSAGAGSLVVDIATLMRELAWFACGFVEFMYAYCRTAGGTYPTFAFDGWQSHG
jgi:hypothetical protein